MIPLFDEGDLVHVTPVGPRSWSTPPSPYGIVIASKGTELKWESRAVSMRYWVLIEDKVWNFSEGELSAVAARN